MKATVSLENYQEHIRQVGLENLPPVLQQGYQFCQDATAYYHQDTTVREAIDLFLSKLSEHLKSKKEGSHTEQSSAELTLIQRFLNMHGKVKTKQQIKAYVQALQRAIRDKSIRKDSILAEDISSIQQKLIEQHNQLNPSGSITITINEAWRKKLKKAVGKSEQKYAPNVLDGLDTIGVEKVNARNHKLSFFDPMDQIEERSSGTTFRLPGALGEFLGELERFELAMTLEGDQGGGKTRFAYQLADTFAKLEHRIAMFSLEIGRKSDLIRRMREQYLTPQHQSQIFITDQLPKGLDSVREAAQHFDVVVLDSWNKTGAPSEEFDRLRKDFPNTIFIVIFQRTTQKMIRGGTAPLYDAGINIEVIKVDDSFVNNYAVATKNRYGITGLHYNISQQKLIGNNPDNIFKQTTENPSYDVSDH